MRFTTRSIVLACAIAALNCGVALRSAHATPTPADKGWEEISNDGGITTWRKDIEGSPIVAFRGEADIDAPIAKVANVLYDTSRKKEWVDALVEAKDIHLISQGERIEYNHTHAPWPIKDRDFVFHARATLDRANQTVTLVIHSVNDPSTPENEDVAVRGELLDSRYVLHEIDGGKKTHLLVEIQADPKGSIPKWIVNLFQKSWPRHTIEGIQRQCAKADVGELASVREYFKKPLAEPEKASYNSEIRR